MLLPKSFSMRVHARVDLLDGNDSRPLLIVITLRLVQKTTRRLGEFYPAR